MTTVKQYDHYLTWRPLLVVFLVAILLSVTTNMQTFVSNALDDKDYIMGACLVNTNQTCPDKEVTFYLYTRHDPDEGQQLLVNDSFSNLADTNFLATLPTKIIVHGYNSHVNMNYLIELRSEYMKRGSYNLIAIDWHRLATKLWYPAAVRNTHHVGNCLAQLVQRLREYGATDIHMIGYSLGAHVLAFAANALRPYRVSRITGLDPSLPFFVTADKDEKLDASDAEFVDVIHTNALIQGKIETCGHIDFYVNGGIYQPGCWKKQWNFLRCSHHKAVDYFIESINSQAGFWGWPCSSFTAYLMGRCPPRFPGVLMGENTNKTHRGIYLVKTRAEKPYAEGMFAVNT